MSNQDYQVIAEFESRRRRQLLVTIPAVIAAGLMLLVERTNQHAAAISMVALIMVSGVLVFSLINWRCPACGSYLGKSLSIRFCHRCGAKLRE